MSKASRHARIRSAGGQKLGRKGVVEIAVAYEGEIITLNEARMKLGFDPVDGGNVFKSTVETERD